MSYIHIYYDDIDIKVRPVKNTPGDNGPFAHSCGGALGTLIVLCLNFRSIVVNAYCFCLSKF